MSSSELNFSADRGRGVEIWYFLERGHGTESVSENKWFGLFGLGYNPKNIQNFGQPGAIS